VSIQALQQVLDRERAAAPGAQRVEVMA